MPGTAAIVGIFGEVDRAVQLDPLARLRVSQFLPEYQHPGVHWYDDFLTWLEETGQAPRPGGARMFSFPSVTEAFSTFTENPPEGRTRARLLFATAVATRAFPNMKDPGSELGSQAVSALTRFAQDENQSLAEGLLKLLSDDQPEGFRPQDVPGTQGWWTAVGERADAERMIPNTIGHEPKPCTARLVAIPGSKSPAAALRTEFDTDEIEFEKATRFMEPVNWPTCRPDFWCCMDAEPDPRPVPGQRRYHEIVSTHCNDPALPGFRAETQLLFNFMWVPEKKKAQAAIANYELAKGRPHEDDFIQVDEGTLVVSKLDARKLRITTTKRVKFNYPLSSYGLALFVCASGWADTGAQLVACAAECGDPMNGGTDFPGEDATAAIKPRGGGAGGSPGGPAAGAPGNLFHEGIDIWARALREGATALERNLGGGGPEGSKKPPRPGS